MANKRTVPCPDCTGEQYVNLFQKATKDLQGLFGSLGELQDLYYLIKMLQLKLVSEKKIKNPFLKTGALHVKVNVL
jgi:hypothetical protein